MPEYLSPGVYVEEIDAGPQPIAAVSTSTAGAVGVTPKGPITPQLITSYGDFLRFYGGPLDVPDEATQSGWGDDGQYWRAAESVKAFFDEGGARMYFQRVQPGGAVRVEPRVQRRARRVGAVRRRRDIDEHHPLPCHRHRDRQRARRRRRRRLALGT